MAFEFTAHDLLFDAIEAERELVRRKNRWIDEARAASGQSGRSGVKPSAAIRLLVSAVGPRSRRRAGSAVLRVARMMRPRNASGAA